MSYDKQISRLLADSKDLVSTLSGNENPEVQRLRDRLNVCILRAEGSRRLGRDAQSIKLTRLPGSIFQYVHQHPWLAIATAASLAYTVANLSTASRGINK
ncbi:MAG: hypothetical protein ABJC66_15520 [Gammaproteobacteria bacterium]